MAPWQLAADNGRMRSAAVVPSVAVVTGEDALVRTARLAALGRLAAGTVHEINNPLFGMLGLVELLLAEAEPETKAHRRLGLVQQSGLELKEFVRFVAAFARAEGADEQPASLEAAVTRALELVSRTSGARSAELAWQPPAGPTLVHGAGSELEQLAVHLLLAVLARAPEGGRVSVVLERAGDAAVLSLTVGGEVVEAQEDVLGLEVSRLLAERSGGFLSDDGGGLVTLRLPVVD